MKKIGILTFWNVPNYGTFLQAYALRNVVQEIRPGDSVELIAYLDKIHYAGYYGIFNYRYKLWPINPRFYLEALGRIRNYKNISGLKSFLKYYETIPHTKPLNANKLKNEKFDTVILGSDIIWDYTFSLFNNDPFLFGNNINADNKISYAASFGTVKVDDEFPQYVQEGIKALDAISVRETKSTEIVKKITGKDSLIVADPTFLWDFSIDSNVIKPKMKDPYIVVYGSYFTDELIEGVCRYSKENGLKIVCLNSLDDTYDWCDINIQQNDLSPYEWLGYFADAEVVMTCTFHGMMFGLIFNKKMVFSPTQFILDKSTSFINALGLMEVLVDYKTFEEKVNWSWDYHEINKRISYLREESINYLKEYVVKG